MIFRVEDADGALIQEVEHAEEAVAFMRNHPRGRRTVRGSDGVTIATVPGRCPPGTRKDASS